MSDPKAASNDPSMDNILASIRKIISDDEARSQVGASTTPGPPAREQGADRDDVLLLTDPLEEAHPATPNRSYPTMAQPNSPGPQSNVLILNDPIDDGHPAASDPSLVGPNVVGAAASALGRLNRAVLDSSPPVAAATPGPSLGGGSSKTIEDMVKEMLRPLLKDWLEHNLPPMVDAIVEREIARLTRR